MDLDPSVPYVTFDEIFASIPDVSAEWELVDGLEIATEWGTKATVRFLESTNAGTKFAILYPDGTHDNAYLGKLRRLLNGTKISLGAASQTNLLRKFNFISQRDRDENERLRKRKIRDQKEAQLKQEKELAAHRQKEKDEAEARRLRDLKELLRLRKEEYKAEQQQRLELDQSIGQIRPYYGDAIPETVQLTRTIVNHLQRAAEDAEEFRKVASDRDFERRSRLLGPYLDDGRGDEHEEWIALATARAILAVKEYIDSGNTVTKLSVVSAWWRKANQPRLSIDYTDHIQSWQNPDTAPAKTSRAAAICDLFGRSVDSEAQEMMAHAIELDRFALRVKPGDKYATNQLGRTLSLSGNYHEGIQTLIAANGDERSLQRELAATLRYMERDHRSAEFSGFIQRMAEDGEIPWDALPF